MKRHREVLLVALVALAVVLPRSVMIHRAQSERVDDEYHLIRGVLFLNGELARSGLTLNDPPVGEAIGVLPVWLEGCWRGVDVVTANTALYSGRWEADAILQVIGIWKSVLSAAFLLVVFLWCRETLGARAGWLVVGMLLVEPTLAAHIPLPTLDVMGVEGIVVACWCAWRFFERPGLGRGAVMGFAVALGMLIKHTGVILPAVVAVMGAMWWWRSRRAKGADVTHRSLAALGMTAAVGIAVFVVSFWGLLGFDVSRPGGENVPAFLQRRVPAGLYVGSFFEGRAHAADGHKAYLFGEKRKEGWWYYFPVVATYKLPVGLWVVLVLGAASLAVRRPAWGEWSIIVPLVAWSALMMTSKINIGFRHFLPALVFMLMLAGRVAEMRARWWAVAAWAAVLVTGVETLRYHPNYLCYINWPREQAYRDISDSNVDWGQGLKAVRRWVEAHPGRKVFVRDFGWGPQRLIDVRKRIGPGAVALNKGDPLPREGVIILSVAPWAGVYERSDPFRALREHAPDEVIEHGMLVYDLDKLRGDKAFVWPKYKPNTMAIPKGWTNEHPQG